MTGEESVLERLDRIVVERLERRPPGSYTVELAERGLPYAARKLGEEAVETMVEALSGKGDALVREAADLLYHLVVLLRLGGRSIGEVLEELERRMGR